VRPPGGPILYSNTLVDVKKKPRGIAGLSRFRDSN
jgi:hypothetical protein